MSLLPIIDIHQLPGIRINGSTVTFDRPGSECGTKFNKEEDIIGKMRLKKQVKKLVIRPFYILGC